MPEMSSDMLMSLKRQLMNAELRRHTASRRESGETSFLPIVCYTHINDDVRAIWLLRIPTQIPITLLHSHC